MTTKTESEVHRISTKILSSERGLAAVHAFTNHCGCALDVIDRIRHEAWFPEIAAGPTIDGVLWAARRVSRREYVVPDEVVTRYPQFYRD
jgi:hypothetical protein